MLTGLTLTSVLYADILIGASWLKPSDTILLCIHSPQVVLSNFTTVSRPTGLVLHLTMYERTCSNLTSTCRYEEGSMDADIHWQGDESAHTGAYHASDVPGMLAHQTDAALGHGQQLIAQGRQRRRPRGGKRHRRSATAVQSAHRDLPSHSHSSRPSASPVPDRAQHRDRHPSVRNSWPQHSNLQRQHRPASYADRSKMHREHQAPRVEHTALVQDSAQQESCRVPRSRSPQRHGASAKPAQQHTDTRPHMQTHAHARLHGPVANDLSRPHRQSSTHVHRHARQDHGPMLPRKASSAFTLQQSGYPS